jgi:hypothetical protein
MEEIAEAAKAAVVIREGSIPSTVKAFVKIISGDKQVLAEVFLGQGIGRPCWTVRLGRQLEALDCKKAVGQG